MQKIFIQNLKKLLNENVKGEVFLHIVDGVLIVEIMSAGLHQWQYIIRNIDMQLVKGLSSKSVSQHILKKYKNYIFSQYFVQNNCNKVLTF